MNWILNSTFALGMAVTAFIFSFVAFFNERDVDGLVGGLQFSMLAYVAAAILKK